MASGAAGQARLDNGGARRKGALYRRLFGRKPPRCPRRSQPTRLIDDAPSFASKASQKERPHHSQARRHPLHQPFLPRLCAEKVL